MLLAGGRGGYPLPLFLFPVGRLRLIGQTGAATVIFCGMRRCARSPLAVVTGAAPMNVVHLGSPTNKKLVQVVSTACAVMLKESFGSMDERNTTRDSFSSDSSAPNCFPSIFFHLHSFHLLLSFEAFSDDVSTPSKLCLIINKTTKPSTRSPHTPTTFPFFLSLFENSVFPCLSSSTLPKIFLVNLCTLPALLAILFPSVSFSSYFFSSTFLFFLAPSPRHLSCWRLSPPPFFFLHLTCILSP